MAILIPNVGIAPEGQSIILPNGGLLTIAGAVVATTTTISGITMFIRRIRNRRRR